MDDFESKKENNQEAVDNNNDILSEENKNVEGVEYNEEGVQENEEGITLQSQADVQEKATDEEQGTHFEEKEDTAEAQDTASSSEEESYSAEIKDNVPPQYSSYYKPPYYVPNFTVVGEPPSPEKKNKKGIGNAWKVIIIAAVLFLIAAFVAVFGLFGYVLSNLKGEKDSGIDMKNEQMNIVQNAPQVNISKNTDSDYVPKSLPEVVSMIGNSVVEIKTSSRVYDRFYGQYVTSGAGSGVIVTQSDEAGYLITNHHVIHNDDNSVVDTITVVLANGEEYIATRIGTDYSIDLSVLRIEKKAGETFTVAPIGDSSNLVVGQDVIAIGNPLGSLGGTVTDGIISALDRRVQVQDVTMVLLQHNAAINPGNSGGGLFDMMGNLVGIVNAKTSESGIEGLGFAIPSNIALDFFNRVMVIEPAIGIQVAYGRPDKLSPVGVYVVETANKDFAVYDRIVKVNGREIETAADYYAIIDCFETGETITITVVRNSENYDITVELTQ